MIFIQNVDGCNFRCTYCITDSNPGRKKIMDIKTREKVIDRIHDYAEEKKKKQHIAWHVNEPLIAGTDFFKSTSKMIDRKLVRESIQTNGSLFNDEMIDFCLENDIKVGFSIDPIAHDNVRVFPNGKGTLKYVMANFEKFQEKGYTPGVITVISKYNHDQIEKVYEFYKNAGIKNVTINPVVLSGRAKEYSKIAVSPDEYADSMCKLFELYFKDHYKKNTKRNIFEKILDLKKFTKKDCSIRIKPIADMINYLNDNKKPNTCLNLESCFKDFITIDVNGNLYPCHRFLGNKDFLYGNVKTKDIKSLLENKTFERNLEKEQCKIGCQIYDQCYGGCPSNAYSLHGTINARDPFTVSYSRLHSKAIELYNK